MEPGSFQLRLFVSVAVILGAALIALIVDYLKGSNEQLRERNIELRVRNEERERRESIPPTAPAETETEKAAQKLAACGGLKRPILMPPPEARSPAHNEPVERVIAVTPLTGPEPENSAVKPAPPPETEASADESAFPQMVITSRPAFSADETESFQQRVVVVKPVALPNPVAAEAPEPVAELAPEPAQVAASEPRPAVEETPAPQEETGEFRELPAGPHEAGVLAEIMERSGPFNGVVAAISVNGFDQLLRSSSRTATVDLPASLEQFIRSLVRQNAFACRLAEDEFLLVYPGECGAAAQRRIEQVSERLWDFQLRSMGSSAIMFSWGAVEASDETLGESVAAARERMFENQRSRRTLGINPALSDYRAVNV